MNTRTSKYRMMIVISILCTCLIMTGTSFAAVPKTMNHQGYLKDTAGNPVNGSVSMTFKLYDVLTGGTALWSETQSSVSVTNGVYNVILGSLTAINLPSDKQYYLSVKVGTDAEMTPRIPLTSVMSALFVDGIAKSSGKFGIGTTTPSYQLHVEDLNPSGDAPAIYGKHAVTDYYGVGVMGSGGYKGVIGSVSATGTNGYYGVHGIATTSGGGGTTYGVRGHAEGGSANYGVYGSAVGGYAVYGTSNGSAAFFTNTTAYDGPDMELGGYYGRINTDPADQNSNLILSSNNHVYVRLDNDGGENGAFQIVNSGGGTVLTIDEAGRLGSGTSSIEAPLHAVNSSTGKVVIGTQSGYSTSDWSNWDPAGLFAGRNGVVGVTKADGGYAVAGRNNAPGTYSWAGYFESSYGDGVYISTPSGQTGLTVSGGSKNAVVRTADGSRLLYSEESSEVWFTDYGFGHLQNGAAIVGIDPVFAQTVNLEEPYHVFVQVYGDADVYVAGRTATQFEVRLHDGDLNVEFSYRLVAKRLGFEADRLERAPFADNDAHLYPEKKGMLLEQGGGQ